VAVKIINCPSWIMEEEKEIPMELSADLYLERIRILQDRMKDSKLDFVIVYGDREHFASIEYFTRYDCRFEEGLFILSRDGERTIVVGNEGEAYSYYIPFEINRIRYRHFSLQGQPKQGSPSLTEIFKQVGIRADSKIGIVGFKYFEDGEDGAVDDTMHHFDIPEYILYELFKITDRKNVINFTKEITGIPDGIRMTVRDPREIAFVEYQAIKTVNVIKRLLKAAKPGMTETEIASYARADLTPTQMYSLVNCTPLSISLGLRSPDPKLKMTLGEVFGLCYSLRGSLCSKVGVAAYDESTICDRLKGKIESFYMKHWLSVATWFETVGVGVTGREVYDAVMNIIGGPEFGVTLNPGHYIGMDEWTNSNVRKDSKIPFKSGSVVQSDIIASSSDPIMTSICEDTIVLADLHLRTKLKEMYPDVYDRIEKRRRFMKEVLNININEDVLPMSSLSGVMFPYMLNTSLIYSKE